MAHAEGWIEAYQLLEENQPIPEKLKNTILNNCNGIGETMLHWYAIEGDIETLEKIIKLGFDINTQNEFKKTPLYECISIEKWDIVKLLLKHGASTEVKDNNDESIWEYLEFNDEQSSINKLRELTRAC